MRFSFTVSVCQSLSRNRQVRAVQVSLLFPNIPQTSLTKDPPAPRKVSRPRFRATPIAAIFRLSVATLAGNIRGGRSIPNAAVWPTGYIVGDMAPRETHGISILEVSRSLSFCLSLPCRPATLRCTLLTHMLDMPVRETRSACHCLVRRALDLPQHIEHYSDFLSADRVVKEKTQAVLGRKRKKRILLIQYAEASRIFHECSFFVRFAVCSNLCAHVPWVRTRKEKKENKT